MANYELNDLIAIDKRAQQVHEPRLPEDNIEKASHFLHLILDAGIEKKKKIFLTRLTSKPSTVTPEIYFILFFFGYSWVFRWEVSELDQHKLLRVMAIALWPASHFILCVNELLPFAHALSSWMHCFRWRNERETHRRRQQRKMNSERNRNRTKGKTVIIHVSVIWIYEPH